MISETILYRRNSRNSLPYMKRHTQSMRVESDVVYRAHGGLSPEDGNGTPSNGTFVSEGTRADMHEMRDIAAETGMLRGPRRAGWGTQFRIMSGRAFKNLYRDPALLTAHYQQCSYFYTRGQDLTFWIQLYADYFSIMSAATLRDSKTSLGFSSSHLFCLDFRVSRAWGCLPTNAFCSWGNGEYELTFALVWEKIETIQCKWILLNTCFQGRENVRRITSFSLSVARSCLTFFRCVLCLRSCMAVSSTGLSASYRPFPLSGSSC